MEFVVVIPAQEKNKYHKKGDLAFFGDTTLLEWKISQCKEFISSSSIYVTSDSEVIKEIANKEEVNFIHRKKNLSYEDMIINTLEEIDCLNIIWINTTSPFMNSSIYMEMLNKFKNQNLSSLISVEKKSEYIFYENEKLNFSEKFISRNDIKPIFIMTNGCYIIKKNDALKYKYLVTSSPSFHEIDAFSAIEIKDVNDYSIARDLISIYFKKEFDV